MNKHDRITHNLDKIVRDSPIRGVNTEYASNNNVVGEIDLYVYHNRILHLFEVKTNPHNEHLYNKALRQLDRAVSNPYMTFHEYMGFNPIRIQKYFVTRRGKNCYNPVIRFVGGVNL